MKDCCCFCPGWYYYMDCRGDFWVPYEVPVDSLDCGRDCWCWQGCPPAAGAAAPAADDAA